MIDQQESSDPVDLEILKRFAPLKSLSDLHLSDLARHAKLIKIKPKTLLFKRQSQIAYKYFLIAGSVDLCDQEYNINTLSSSLEKPLQTALNLASPTDKAAVTKAYSYLLLVDADRLDLVLTWAQAGDYLVSDLDDVQKESDWMSDLLQSNLLQRVPPTNIQQLFSSFKHVDFRSGAHIIRQNEPGEHFFVLKQGSAEVTKIDIINQHHVLATLSPGQFFGEEALISDSKRNATVTMLTDGACMRLDKTTFNRLLKDPVLRSVSKKQVESMQKETENVRIVDVRSNQEVESEPLENVIHIPFQNLREQLDQLDTKMTYITHAINGRRAELAAYLMSEAGLDALVMRKR